MSDNNAIALGIKVPDAMATLGSVLSNANAAQNYRTSQFDLAKKQATLQSDIAHNQADTDIAQADAQKAQQAMTERQNITGMMKSGVDDRGNSILGDNQEPDPAKILPALGRIAPLTGQDYAQNILKTQGAKIGLESAATTLDSQQRSVLMGPLQAIATNPDDPAMVDAASQTIDAWGQAHPEMAKVVNGAKLLFSHVQSAPTPELRAHLANSMAAMFQGGTQVQTQPQTGTVNTGAQTLFGATAPPVAGGQFSQVNAIDNKPHPAVVDTAAGLAAYSGATNSITPVGGYGNPAPPPGNAPPAAPQWHGTNQLQYPVRAAGQPYTPGPSEPENTKAGQDYRTNLAAQQSQLPTIKRNNQELQNQIAKVMGPNFLTSGVLGNAWRSATTALGDPTYKQLSKDLANAQISALQTAGGSMATDAGKTLIAHANGDETYPPDVLRNIARRASADIQNADMQATAAQKFSQQFGDNNMATFRQEWNKNADSKVFEAINLYNNTPNAQDPIVKKNIKAQIDSIFGNDPKQRAQYQQKYRNIISLTNKGTL